MNLSFIVLIILLAIIIPWLIRRLFISRETPQRVEWIEPVLTLPEELSRSAERRSMYLEEQTIPKMKLHPSRVNVQNQAMPPSPRHFDARFMENRKSVDALNKSWHSNKRVKAEIPSVMETHSAPFDLQRDSELPQQQPANIYQPYIRSMPNDNVKAEQQPTATINSKQNGAGFN